jgi:multidrug efflux pump subunit AcrB
VTNPIRSIALALVLPVLGFASLPLLTAQFFPGVDRDQFTIEVDLAPGTALNATREVVATLDRRWQKRPASKASHGSSAGRPRRSTTTSSRAGRRAGLRPCAVRTASAEATETILPQLQRSLPTLAPEAQVLVRGLVQGPPVDAPVELRIVGPDIATLREEGARLRRLMAGQDEVTLARASITEGAPKVVFDVDEAEARRLGLSLADVAGQLEAALVGRTGGTLVEGTESLPIRVRLGDALRSDAAAIADIGILPAGPRRRSATGELSRAAAVGHRRDAARTRRGHDHPPQRRAREHACRPSCCAVCCPRRRWRACRPRWRRRASLCPRATGSISAGTAMRGPRRSTTCWRRWA